LILFVDGIIPKTAFRGVFDVKEYGHGTLTLYKENANDPMKIIPVSMIDGKFPNYQQVMDVKGYKDVDEVSFNPIFLSDIVNASGVKWSGIRMKFSNQDTNDLLVVEIQDFPKTKVGLMPMRFGAD